LHLADNFEDGFYIGEVFVIMDLETGKIVTWYQRRYPLPLITSPPPALNLTLFFYCYWPYKQVLMNTNRAALLPLRPVLKVFAPPCTKRFVIFKLEKLDFVENFAEL
jgi:hypothetical protein